MLVECWAHAGLQDNISVEDAEDVCGFMESVGYAKIAKTYNTSFWVDGNYQ